MATHTTTTPLSTVIGVFPNHEQADNAIDELRRAHFGYEHIRVIQHGTGSFVDTLKGMFTGQASVASNTAESLTKMGMPDYEAQYYQRELDADHVLILMNADDRPEEAFNIMRQNGAFDINSRLRTSPADGSQVAASNNGSRETRNVDVPPAISSPNVEQSTPYPDGARTTYDPNMPAREQSTPYSNGAQTTYDPNASDEAQTTYDPNTPDVAPSSDPDQPVDRDTREAPRNA